MFIFLSLCIRVGVGVALGTFYNGLFPFRKISWHAYKLKDQRFLHANFYVFWPFVCTHGWRKNWFNINKFQKCFLVFTSSWIILLCFLCYLCFGLFCNVHLGVLDNGTVEFGVLYYICCVVGDQCASWSVWNCFCFYNCNNTQWLKLAQVFISSPDTQGRTSSPMRQNMADSSSWLSTTQK